MWQEICGGYIKFKNEAKMKKILLLTFITILGFQNSEAQFMKDAKKLLNTGSKGFTEKDAADAIKEALENGTNQSVKLVSVADGYWGNPEIKIPFPPEARGDGIQTKSYWNGEKSRRI